MKKNIIFGCVMAASMFTAFSCQDFLDEDPQGKLTPEKYFSTQAELDMSVYALCQQVNRSQIYTNMQYPQWQGDDITANPGSNKQACAELDRFAGANNNKGVKDCWTYHYNIIKAANLIVNSAASTPTSQEEINIAIGQAKFWRAYAYYTLVRLFGPLPVNTNNENDGGKTPLTSVEDIYKLILADLEEVDALNLPVSYSGEPRNIFGCDVYVTQQAVKATLSAVYMSMAGYPLNKTEYYAKAAEMAKQVIDGKESGKYDIVLDSEWKNVYSMGNNYNKETVLAINFSPVADWAKDSELASCNMFESQGGWGDGWGEIRFWKNMPEGPRKAATYDPQIRLRANGHLVDWWATTDGQPVTEDKSNAVVPEYHPMFSVFTCNNSGDDNGAAGIVLAPYDYTKPFWTGMCNDHRHRLIRYSEVLLWYAESAARAGQDLTKAKQCLKEVRQRAVNADEVNTVNGVNIDAMSADQLAEAAYEEHGWEVAGYWVALVPRRSDQFRMNRLKDAFEYRAGAQEDLIIPAGTLTHSVDKDGNPFTYTLTNDLKLKESVSVVGSWDGDNTIYLPYPDTDAEKNPNLKR